MSTGQDLQDHQADHLVLFGPIKLANSKIRCWKCSQDTPVSAIVASDLEEVVAGEGSGHHGSSVFVHQISTEDMPKELAEALRQHAPHYQQAFSQTTQIEQWANVCAHCNALQGAFFLHMEPDGPFFGGPEHFEAAPLVEIHAGDLVVGDAGYTL